MPHQFAHGEGALLDIAAGDHFQFARQYVASNVGHHVVVVCQPQRARIERDGVVQQEATQEVGHSLGGVLRHDTRQLSIEGVLDAVPDHAQPGKDPVVLTDMRGELAVERRALREFEVLPLKIFADQRCTFPDYGRRYMLRHEGERKGCQSNLTGAHS